MIRSLLAVCATLLLGPANLRAALVYIGDGAIEGQAVSPGDDGPDGANGGSITYAFFDDNFTNDTGGPLSVRIEEVNFWANNPGTLTPFVAIFDGFNGESGESYVIAAVGDPIEGVVGANNATFVSGDEMPTVTLQDGEQLAAGFHQGGGMVPWAGGSGDYLKENDVIPEAGGTLPDSTTWAGLDRGYKFNIGIETEVADSDNDGMPDEFEEDNGLNPDDPADAGLDPDADTLTNLEEFENGTDPNEADSDEDTLRDDAELDGAGDRPPTNPRSADTDGDGLSDAAETNTGTFVSAADTGTDPTAADTDGDTLDDSDEIEGNNPDSFTSDPNSVDTDGDGFDDGFEVANGTDPDNSGDFPTTIYIGDLPDAGADVPEGTIGPDTANLGDITYAFFSDPYINSTGGEQSLVVTQVNFWANATGTLTPYVALYDGLDPTPGGSYMVLAVGDPIEGELGLNNARFEVAGENPVLAVQDGDALVAGFHQTGGNPNGMIPWESPDGSDPDYIGSGNSVPTPDLVPVPLAGDANWSTLNREYRFNVALEPGTGPDPFLITDVVLDQGASEATITWNSRPSRVYAVDASADLERWDELDDGVESEGAQTTFTETPLPPGVKRRYWRVRDIGAN